MYPHFNSLNADQETPKDTDSFMLSLFKVQKKPIDTHKEAQTFQTATELMHFLNIFFS